MKKTIKRSCYLCGDKHRPLSKCGICHNYTCYDHLNGIIGKKGIEDYCDKCIKIKVKKSI